MTKAKSCSFCRTSEGRLFSRDLQREEVLACAECWGTFDHLTDEHVENAHDMRLFAARDRREF